LCSNECNSTPLGRAPANRLGTAGCPAVWRIEEIEDRAAVFDLSIYLAETADGLSAMLRYYADLYDATTAERVLDDFEAVLRRVLDAPDERLSALNDHLAAERRRRLEAGREDLQKARLRTLGAARRRVVE